MPLLTCPHCGAPLLPDGRSLRCNAGHCFDIARQGYVNLLTAAGGHGDDLEMVRARNFFLEKGWYRPLADALCESAVSCIPEGGVLLDAGCGEGWYTAQMYTASRGRNASVVGIDVSRDALKICGRRLRGASFPGSPEWALAAASIWHIPVADASCSIVTCVFAPSCEEEFLRVLVPGGHFFRVSPLEDHLWELKAAVYETPRANDPAVPLKSFLLADTREIRGSISLSCPEDIRALFYMTPYAYRTDAEGKTRLDMLDRLDTRIAFRLEHFIRPD